MQIEICNTKQNTERFLKLPDMLYTQKNITGNRTEEYELINGTHFLNRYIRFTAFIAVSEDRVLGRCAITEYQDDYNAYFGFFECVDDFEVAKLLISYAEEYAGVRGYLFLKGPMDASMWIRYRFKVNNFDMPPYCGEPYNLPYYADMFYRMGYEKIGEYASNRYRRLPRKQFELAKYREHYLGFLSGGYKIVSPKRNEWDSAIADVYRMISKLYTGFEGYIPITEDEFISRFSYLKDIADMSLIKIGYFEGRAVGFFIGIPDYGNLESGKHTFFRLIKASLIRFRPKRYVLLYMGVEKEHKGLGKALTHAIMKELAKKGATSIGALIREGNTNYDYAKEYMEGRYSYVFLGKSLKY